MRAFLCSILLVACTDETKSYFPAAPDAGGGTDAAGPSADGGRVDACSGDGCGGSAGGGSAGTAGRSGGGAGGQTGSGGAAGAPGGDACVTDLFALESAPLDVHVLLDTSGSMADPIGSVTKWSVVSDSLARYLQNAAGSGIGTGITYFPAVVPGVPTTCLTDQDCVTAAGDFGPCTGTVLPPFGCLGCVCALGGGCSVEEYSTPAVPITLLGDPTPLVTSILSRSPAGGTPTRPALEGTVTYVSQWAAAHPERKVVIVLATDGDPSQCTTNTVPDVANVAAAAFASGIPTFVIGVGSSLTSLNAVASAGGTGQAYIIDTAADVGQAFTNALNEIRALSTECVFSLPAAATEPAFVNVQVTASAAEPTIVPQVATAADCGSSVAWYYDQSAAPTAVHLCPAACASISTDNLEAAVGCTATVQAP